MYAIRSYYVGIQAMFGYKITILTGMIPPLIIVIGIPNSVFLLNKYHQEYRKHQNKIKALQRVIRKVGNATLFTNLTTAAGFATFVFTSSAILVEFGVIASINIIVIFILSILLIPIVFSFLTDPKEKHTKHLDNQTMTKAVNLLVKISLNHRKAVYIITISLLVIGLWGVSRIKTTGYMLDDIPHRITSYNVCYTKLLRLGNRNSDIRKHRVPKHRSGSFNGMHGSEYDLNKTLRHA